MPGSRKKWSLRRWRHRWRERAAAVGLRWRIWFDRHILSHETRRRWRRRWHRRSQRLGLAVENVGYKVLPHRPETMPETRWTRLILRLNAWIERLYPAAARVRHARLLRQGWYDFTAPFRHANARVHRAFDTYFLPALTPAGFRKHFVNWRGLLALVLLSGGVALTGFWLLPRWARHAEHKRAAQARLLLDRGYYSLANQYATRVLQHNNQNVAASRVVAEMLERQGLANALAWRHKIVQLDRSLPNQLALAATALRFETPSSPTAARILAETADRATNLVQYRTVAAQFEAKNGNFAAAENHYLAALALAPTNAELELSLAILRLKSPSSAKAALAEQTLESLVNRTNIGVRALRPLVLRASARGDYQAAREYSERILAGENSTFDDRLVHLTVLSRNQDPDRERFLRVLQEQVSANAIYVSQLAGWMIVNSDARAALTWIETLAPAVRKAEPVSFAMTDAYAALGDWRGLEQFLVEQRPGWGTIEYVRQAMLARAYRGLGQPRTSEECLRRATELASGMALRLTNLARLVTTWGWDAEAEEMVWTIAERFPEERWAVDSLLRRYYERGNSDKLRQVFALQLQRSPKDLSIKNNLAMLLLLLRKDLPTAHAMAREVYLQNPTSAVNTSTYAFSLYVQGRIKEGRQLLDKLGPETLKVPSIAAYYAILVDATGDSATARSYVALARGAQLLPEEQAMLERIRSRP